MNQKTLDVNPEQHNFECYIVGGGPSLKNFNWSKLNDKFVIAINRSYEVLPQAQILYFTDPDYWKDHSKAMREHGGAIVRGVLRQKTSDSEVIEYHLTGTDGLSMDPGKLRHGSNSTYAATNLAVQLGFKTIYLLGIDMKWGKTGDKTTSHWHSGHKRVDGESVYKKMIKNWETLVEPLAKLNVQVFNVNTPDGTNLKVFPIKSFEQVFGD